MRFLKLSTSLAALFASAVLLSGLLALRAFPGRGADPPAASRNGDVNCDGKLNITDAISILEHVFRDGPAPCALADDGSQESLDELKRISGSLAALAGRWAPRPEDIVYVQKEVPQGERASLYTVPEGRCLVLVHSSGGAVIEMAGDTETPVTAPISTFPGVPVAGGSTLAIQSYSDPLPGQPPVRISITGILTTP